MSIVVKVAKTTDKIIDGFSVAALIGIGAVAGTVVISKTIKTVIKRK